MRSFLTPFLLVCLMLILAGCSTHRAKKEAVCWDGTAEMYGGRSPQDINLILNSSIEEYQQLVEMSLVYRTKAIALAERLHKTIDADQPLKGRDLDILNRGMVQMVDLRDQLLVMAYRHACWPEASQQDFLDAGVDSILPETQLQGVMLSLSASLLLYDNYLLMISIFEEDAKLRQFLNDSDTGYGINKGELKKATKNFISHRNRRYVRESIASYEQMKLDLPTAFQDNDNVQYLEASIDISPSYQRIKKAPHFFLTGEDMRFLSEATSDHLHDFSQNSLDMVSKFFGNSVGLVSTRKGRLHGDDQVVERLESLLKPGDILLEKTPFRLTDKLIPGHWGHAAIWVGTESELRDLGLWDHPLIARYHDDIRNGHSIIEALRSGVEINTLEHFVNVDDLAVLRKKILTDEVLTQRLILAFRQIGKAYDFNFDVETTDKIVCSELVYTVYIDMDWPTENAMGRYTISPDHVALKALENGPLELITLYHKGKLVTVKPLEVMEDLLQD